MDRLMKLSKILKSWWASHKEDYLWLALKSLVRKTKGVVGGAVILILIAAAVLAPYISPYDPNEMHPHDKLQLPSSTYLLGTDMFGRDLLSRIVWGARMSVYVGIISVSIALLIGVPIGLVSGYCRGKIDEAIMRVMDALLSFPAILLALVMVTVLGVGVQNLMIAVGVVFTPQYARVARGTVLAIREKEFVQSALSVGDTHLRVLFGEIFPNCLAPLIVQSSIGFAYAVLYEAALSFLGLGIQPPTPAWGSMLAEARAYMEEAPWVTIVPGLAIMVAVMGFNLFGDALRDALDPRLRIE
jgi:peptide/nickel transport system permease protein